MSKISQNLSKLIKEKNISQAQMAVSLGVGQQTVSKYINGKLEPNLDTVIKITKYFDVTSDYLLGIKD